MKFKDFPYERPQLSEVLAKAETIAQNIENAKSADEVLDGIKAWEALQSHFSTMANVAHIRYTVDTTDPFYLKEKEYLDDARPRMMTAEKKVLFAIANSAFAKDIDEKYGPHYLNTLRMEQKLLDERLVEPMIEESRLASAYQKRMAACQVMCCGQVRNFYGLLKLMEDDDREVRKEAYRAYCNFFKENQDFFDDVYDKLVHLRHSMAKIMGYENFIPVAYMRKGRSDYGPEEVAASASRCCATWCPCATSCARTRPSASAWTSCASTTRPTCLQPATPRLWEPRKSRWSWPGRCTTS